MAASLEQCALANVLVLVLPRVAPAPRVVSAVLSGISQAAQRRERLQLRRLFLVASRFVVKHVRERLADDTAVVRVATEVDGLEIRRGREFVADERRCRMVTATDPDALDGGENKLENGVNLS
jgi:hypothetical protein